jgi:hypothetical protein
MIGAFFTYWEKGEIHRGLWWENFTDRFYLVELGVDGRRISESILNTCDGIAWTVFIGLRLEAGGCAVVKRVMNVQVS